MRGAGQEPALAGAHLGPTEEWKEVSGSASERPVSRKEVLSCGHGIGLSAPEPSETGVWQKTSREGLPTSRSGDKRVALGSMTHFKGSSK